MDDMERQVMMSLRRERPTLVQDLNEANERVHYLTQCVKEALNYRPLPTDPYQVFVRKRAPEVLDEWNNERNG